MLKVLAAAGGGGWDPSAPAGTPRRPPYGPEELAQARAQAGPARVVPEVEPGEDRRRLPGESQSRQAGRGAATLAHLSGLHGDKRLGIEWRKRDGAGDLRVAQKARAKLLKR